ncbi:hypothetical protein Tco_0893371 [Tanacetum coccineum]|uniref:Uncharacterized protein n=1 Tax=Tanacetum coccineum TaxID=301880 RepID=A0ABQ5CA56_9ASTR
MVSMYNSSCSSKRPPPLTNCISGLSAVKTWQQVLNKEFRIIISKKNVGGSSDVRRKGKRKMRLEEVQVFYHPKEESNKLLLYVQVVLIHDKTPDDYSTIPYTYSPLNPEWFKDLVIKDYANSTC